MRVPRAVTQGGDDIEGALALGLAVGVLWQLSVHGRLRLSRQQLEPEFVGVGTAEAAEAVLAPLKALRCAVLSVTTRALLGNDVVPRGNVGAVGTSTAQTAAPDMRSGTSQADC